MSDEQRREETEAGAQTPRCTICGSQRIVGKGGRPGACSLIGCRDPLFDVDTETARTALARLAERACSGVAPDDEDLRSIVEEQKAVTRMLGLARPRGAVGVSRG